MANLNLSEFTEKLFVADADHTFIWDTANAISKRVSRNSWLNSGTLTSDAPVTISQTWTTTGTYTAAKVNVTETATANTLSRLLDLQLGAVSKLAVRKDGSLLLLGTAPSGVSTAASAAIRFTGSGRIEFASEYSTCGIQMGGAGTLITAPVLTLGGAWVAISNDAFGNNPSYLVSEATNTLALRNGEAPQTFRLYNTYSAGGTNFERLNIQWSGGAARIFPDAGGTGTLKTVYLGSDSVANNAFLVNGASNLVQINTSGVERMRITSAGNVGIGTTSPTSKLHVAETWNAAGTTFTAVNVNVTDTASAATSKLLNLQVEGVSKFSVDKSGIIALPQTGGDAAALICGGTAITNAAAYIGIYGIRLDSTSALQWSSGKNLNTLDTILLRDGEADHLAMRRSTNGQKFSVYGTYPGAAWERFTITAPTSGNVLLGTYKGTGGIARGLELQADGTTRMLITAAGAIIQRPLASVTPPDNGDLVIEATSNTTLTFKLKGTDGTVRTGTITLA